MSPFATFQWTTGSGASGYYLYVGTTPGAKDVVNTGNIQATSYTVKSPLPPGANLWARIWTNLNGIWTFQADVTFTVSPDAVLVYPFNGQQNVPASPTFQWTSTPGAQGYSLTVGTIQGASDVLNTGSIQTTSYAIPSALPAGATLWARLSTNVNGAWAYQGDVSFTVSAASLLVFPTNGQQGVSATATFQWTSSRSAAAYYLYVGTTQGAKDVVNTGSIQATSYTPKSPLPARATLWARIYTNLNGVWVYQPDVSFTVSPTSALVYPLNGENNVPSSPTFQWTSSSGAQAYSLTLGTTQGASDVLNTGSIQGTAYTVPSTLPAGVTLWARLSTNLNGSWTFQGDVAFSVSAASVLAYPLSGQQSVPTNATFQWTSGAGALGYYLYVGTTQGAHDVVNTGQISATSYTPPSPLPAGATLWARIWTNINGSWVYQADVSFTVSSNSVLIYPTSGQQNVPALPTFQWTSTASALGYYLYVGKKQGAKDVVDTGSTQATSFAPKSALPAGTTLWARIYTNLNGTWSYQTDVSFSVSAASTLAYPSNGQQNVPAFPTFQWTSSPGAQAYSLTVGTTQGAGDLLNTGSIQATSYTVQSALQTGATLWARLSTNVNGSWTYQGDVSFRISADAVLTYPINAQQGVPATATFQWTSSPGALGYYLYVGTSQGANNVVNTGQIQATSLTVTSPLPPGATLWARIYTNLSGSWVYLSDVSFTVSTSAVLSFPTSGQQNVNTSLPFQWTAPANAQVQAYHLYVGTAPGSNDIVDSGEIQGTSYSVPPLPVGRTLYARILTEIDGGWIWSYDVPFTAALRFGYPAIQSIGISPATAFTWSSVSGGSGTYDLSIGSSPGANDLYENTRVQQPSFTVPASALPTGRTLYARIRVTPGDGVQRRADTIFTVDSTPVVSPQIIYPADGAQTVDVSQPFHWTPSDLAQAYRLQIADSSSSLVVDSGQIRTPYYFAETLPPGSYTGQIGSEIAGAWYWTPFSFTVTNTAASMSNELSAAFWATDFVRNMADGQNYPFAWTLLANKVSVAQQVTAVCTNYRDTLLAVLSQMQVAARMPSSQQPHSLNIAFKWGGATHTLVEFWNTDQQRWMLLDPTFDLTVMNAADGSWATKEQMNSAVLNQQWTAMNYKFLGSWGNSLAKTYYLDYPLLYLNLPPILAAGQGAHPLPYLVQQPGPPLYQSGVYTFQCSGSVALVINGAQQQIDCKLIDSLSGMRANVSSVELPQGSTANVTIYAPVRNVF